MVADDPLPWLRTVAPSVKVAPEATLLSLTEGDWTTRSGLPPPVDGGALPKLCAKIKKSVKPIEPSEFRSIRASYVPSPRSDPNACAKIRKSEKPTQSSPSKSGEGEALNVITLVVMSSSLAVVLSASVTDSIPMENSRPVTSETVVNSARARKPEDANLAGLSVPKRVPVEPAGTARENALFSASTKDNREESKSNSRNIPIRDVLTPVAKTSIAIVVPRPETVPDVTPSSAPLPAPPSAMRSSDKTALALGPAVA